MTNKELQHIAPILAELKSTGLKMGFTTPQNYFEDVEERVVNKLTTQFLPDDTGMLTPNLYFDDLEDTILEKIHIDDHTSSVPKGYFETFEDRVFEKLAIEEKKSKIISIRKSWIGGMIAVAASVLLFFTLYKPATTDKIELAEIESYIIDGNIDIDSYELADAINIDDLETIEFENTIKQNDLEDYLLDAISEENLYN